ncbi:putative toxin-antitoxin system toxin component, PIN family [Candidatus Roizmanbacteria bacterium RIFCSPHIGHO2_02_FULL_37_13b]|uniref:Putative toxin-antitoxin system toxin component, PIN family n=1 Tax=Candidatus Roizmanbacteria bacterium RIFCSPLOWO2_02_FULL_36_11 TaxID=1802071 RepID=A0A1F7JH83_9BACT|nr:MAG: putative toxin-antitoxin system toxin component, PIN family [Candidatus Roizmanbacteria bacterium RIFCSPHIGHO2_02_FULL_37_13b]OGK54977.1 MAG: putative toxin-antitoxin system toxin component, PIN family [Candidatus Roizmanbacteria bacterium RIFCSPLOWO2_02_FULL_36_11]
MIKVFFDASVIFSGMYSVSGASSRLLTMVKGKQIIGLTTQTVIEELNNNLHKIPKYQRYEIDKKIIDCGLIVREKITTDEKQPFTALVNQKDVHVIAGAVLTHSDYLITLDKKHLNNKIIRDKIKKVKIISPKDLLATIFKGLLDS